MALVGDLINEAQYIVSDTVDVHLNLANTDGTEYDDKVLVQVRISKDDIIPDPDDIFNYPTKLFKAPSSLFFVRKDFYESVGAEGIKSIFSSAFVCSLANSIEIRCNLKPEVMTLITRLLSRFYLVLPIKVVKIRSRRGRNIVSITHIGSHNTRERRTEAYSFFRVRDMIVHGRVLVTNTIGTRDHSYLREAISRVHNNVMPDYNNMATIINNYCVEHGIEQMQDLPVRMAYNEN